MTAGSSSPAGRAATLKPAVASFLLGALSVLGYAPFHLYPVPVLALAAAALLWLQAPRPRTAGLLGLSFGLGLFGAGVSWVYVSLHDFGGMPALVAAGCTAAFCAYLALYPAAAAACLRWSRLPAAPALLLLLPATWTLAEWLRGWILTGFPWLAIGYSQVPLSPLAGYAPLLGGYGVSLATALLAGITALAVHCVREQHLPLREWPRAILTERAIWLGVAVLAAGLALQTRAWTRPQGEPTSVALVQGNVPQELKWRPDRARQTLDLYRELALASRARLILLPETALPMFNVDLPPGYLERLAAHARGQGGDLLTGIAEYAGPGRYYNSVISVGISPAQTYRKVHLVPFGDYFPLTGLFGWFMNLLQIPMSDFSRGSPDQAPLAVGGQKVAANICYEDVFGEEIIRQLPQATLLANFTNDAWWGRSLGSKQHLQIAQMRSAETGRFMVRATNTGVTAIIDPRGRIVKAAPEFEVAVLEGEVRGYTGATPYVRWGNALALLPAGALALAAAALRWRRKAV
ncbi:MAG TPA: apolipoprotein N-acyltransferase [Burkholderiales bacterium]|nr:apolipoprotein N-acyltransferase [Burkholderiales bacterium]